MVLSVLACSSNELKFEAPTLYYNEVPVQYEKNTQIVHAGTVDRLGAGIGFIYWNPNNWDILSPNLKFYVLFHEICHLNIPTENQYEADCCSLKILNTACMLSDKELTEIVELLGEYDLVDRQIEIMLCFEKLQKNSTI